MWWKSLLLGIIQGLTEFLPISSSGHLVLASELLNVNAPGNLMEVMLHLGTLLSVVVCFWHKITALVIDFFSLFSKKRARIIKRHRNYKYQNLSIYLIVASLPAVVTGLVLDSYFSVLFDKVIYTGIALLFTGTVLWWADKSSNGRKGLSKMKVKDALIIGLWQSIAVIPGISRAGMTISAGFKRGLKKEDAVEWSFLMAIPIIAGATVVKIPAVLNNPAIDIRSILIGTIAAFAAGILAIKLLLRIIKQRGWRMFAVYCWLVGIIIVITTVV